jgi:hypothetical protein
MATDNTEERCSEPVGGLSALGIIQDDFRVREFDHEMFADAHAMRQLRAALDAFASEHGDGTEPDAKIQLERPHVIALLTELHSGLSDSLKRPANLGSADKDDLEVVFDHPTMALLQKFVDALADLDNAKKAAVFKPAVQSRGSSLRRSEIRRRHALLELVDVYQAVKKLPKRADAEKALAEKMIEKVGRDKALSAKQLHEMRKTRTRQRRRTEN